MTGNSIDGPLSIPWENQDPSGLGGLSNKKKARLEQSVNRMNSDLRNLQYYKQFGYDIPKDYMDYAKNIVAGSTLSSVDRKNTEVTIAEETYVIDREKARVYYENNIAAQIFNRVQRPLTKFKWEVKQYALKGIPQAVKYTKKFSTPKYINLELSDQYDTGIGWYVGYKINRFDLLENKGELFDIQYETMLEASTQMARAANQHIFSGYGDKALDDAGNASSSIGKTGFCNNSSNQTFTISTPSTYGNITSGIKSGLSDLKKVYASNYTICLMTAGLVDQMELNHTTYSEGVNTEYDQFMKRLVGPNKPIKEFWTSDNFTGETVTLAKQKAFLIKLDERLMNRLMVLPLQTIPTTEKTFDDDISEIMLAADIIRFNPRADTTVNPFPATISGAVTTTNLGYLSEERIA